MSSLRSIAIGLCALVIPVVQGQAQRNCRTGIPCGNTCISSSRTCRVGSPPSSPSPSPTPSSRPAPAAPPPAQGKAPLVLAPSIQPPVTTAASSALTVAGVPGYIALDTIELLEVQGARLRALERLRASGQLPGASVVNPVSSGSESGARATSPSTGLLATPNTTSGPWVGSSRGSTYYRNGCSSGNALAAQNRIYFQSEQEAQAAGYRRSSARRC